MRVRSPRWTLAAVGLFSLASSPACDGDTQAPTCPPCDCEAAKGDTAAVAAVAAAPATGSVAVATGAATGTATGVEPPPEVTAKGDALATMREVGELTASASRNMFHENGKQCLADLDRLAALDPSMAARLEITRGQCEMLVGQCQGGKARIAKWYEREMAMTPPRAAETAEQLASMRCRGGDATERDQLLAALFDLSDGAYMNVRPASFCESRLATARKLLPKVPAKGPNDGQVTGGGQALFHTAAACFVHSGECKRAYAVYRELFPGQGLSQIADRKMREQVVADSFSSSFATCPKAP